MTLPECLSVSDNTLYIEGCGVPALAEEFGTPLNVVSEAQLRQNAQRIQVAFEQAWAGPVQVLVSIKANNCLALRSLLSQEGFGCDAYGPAEFGAALAGGTDPAMVSLNGSFKDRQLLARAIEVGARVTIDSAPELALCEEEATRLGTVAKVRLRIRLWLPQLMFASEARGDGIPMGIGYQIAKYGVPANEVVALGQQAIASEHLELTGIHFHSGRHTTDLGVWEAIAQGYAAELLRLSKAWGGYTPREIDMGGGLPSATDPVGRRVPEMRHRPAPPSIAGYAEAIASTMRRSLERGGMDLSGTVFEVEPGRSVYGSAAIHAARVLNVKVSTDPFEYRWLGLDTTQLFLGSTVIERACYPIVVANRASEKPVWTVDVVGRTCLVDRIIPGAVVPEVEVGDTLAFVGTGAYDEALSANFNGLPRPATVLVHGEEAELIRRAEVIEDVFARDIVPTRLSTRPVAAG
jgi:diaminopimelate decarboxylase